MQLINLNYPMEFKRRLVSLEVGMERQLEPYRLKKEISAFVRLGTKLLLALTSENDDDLESVADHLAVSCATMDNLRKLSTQLEMLHQFVNDRIEACDGQAS